MKCCSSFVVEDDQRHLVCRKKTPTVFPEVADKTNPGKDASPTGRAEVGTGCAVSAGGSFLA